MIIREIQNTAPSPSSIGKLLRNVAQPIKERRRVDELDYCFCNECEYIEDVFAISSGDEYKNDKTSFLFEKSLSTDTIVFKLFKNGSEIAAINNNTYGSYYASFTSQPLYTGVIIDWKKVLTHITGGTGIYQIKIEQTILGNTTTIESHKFKLQQFSVERANKTVKIEIWQTGSINGGFDYSNLLQNGWYSSVRIKGKLLKLAPKIVDDSYLTQNYEYKQIQSKIINEYELQTNLVPSFISNELIYNGLISNKIVVTDYNIYNTDIIRQLNLYPLEVKEKKSYSINRNSIFLIKFTERFENIIKTNFA